jgi:hypothetical protein
MRAIPLLALTTFAVACGEKDITADDTAGQTDTGEQQQQQDDTGEVQPDTTPPTVLAIFPEDGATGVRGDVQVVITFSEPMDEASVENALLTNSIGLVSLDWNEDFTTLTITPDDELPYREGQGINPNVVDAFEFHVTLGNGGEDLAGNPTAAGIESSFTTLKLMSTVVEPWTSLTGSATPSGQSTDDDDYIIVGDDTSDIGHRGFFTFDPSLSWTTVEIVEATLSATVISDDIGKPYKSLGSLFIEPAWFLELDNAAFNADPLSDGQRFAKDGDTSLHIDLTEEADYAWANKEDLSYRMQWRLRFEDHTDLDTTQDMVFVGRKDLALKLTYLVP